MAKYRVERHTVANYDIVDSEGKTSNQLSTKTTGKVVITRVTSGKISSVRDLNRRGQTRASESAANPRSAKDVG